jgi:membrane-bound lytic murein transglycosylase D
MAAQPWQRYVAPAAFLLAVTIAVVLIRSGLESGSDSTSPPLPSVPTRTVAASTTTASAKTTTTSSAPQPRFWTVRAGDTFGVISSASGVPVSTIEHLNPNVSSTSLFIGEKLRLR